MLFIIKYRFFRTKEVGTISSLYIEICTADKTTVNYKPNTKWSFNLQPNTIICEAQAKKLKNSKIVENKAVQAKKSVR